MRLGELLEGEGGPDSLGFAKQLNAPTLLPVSLPLLDTLAPTRTRSRTPTPDPGAAPAARRHGPRHAGRRAQPARQPQGLALHSRPQELPGRLLSERLVL